MSASTGTGDSRHSAGSSTDLATVLGDLLAGCGRSAPEVALQRLCDRALALLPAAAVATLITSEDGGLPPSVTAGLPLSEALLQAVASGPVAQLHSQRSRDLIVMADLRRARQWPGLCGHARAAGLLSLTVAPLLSTPQGSLGALVVGHDRPGGLSPEQSRQLEALTAAVADFERVHRGLARAWRVAAQLERALSTRIVIEQAKGFLAGRLAISPGDAFNVLRGYARPRNQTVSDTARRLLEGSLDPAALLRDAQPPAPEGSADGACA